MPWFRVDDTFAMHEKVMAAGNAAIGLWTRAGAWSMQQLTDGFVPNHVIRSLGTPKERRTLVEVSLWEEVEGGVSFQNWTERQPTKEQIESARQAAADRQRHARVRAKSRRDSQRESRDSHAVSHGPPNPTQPNPTRSSYGTTDGADKPPASRARQLPDDFRPSESHEKLAADLGVDLAAEWSQFTDHHRAKGSAMKNWDAALRTWIRNAKRFGSRPAPQPERRRHLIDARDLELPPDGLSPAEYAEWDRQQRAKRRQ
jgi:hypothetical protein